MRSAVQLAMRNAKRWAALAATLALVSIACSSTDSNVGTDGGAGDGGDDGGTCCPPDPHPGCCMKFGGWAGSGGCMEACDGMPIPGDPGWKLQNDSHGCSTWVNESTRPAHICGELMLPDSGADSATDASDDAADSGGD